MKTYVVTSSVTFVPKNYDDFIAPLAKSPHVAGLIIIDNRSWDVVVKGLALLMTSAAPRMGLQLLKNHFDDSINRKKKYFSNEGKDVFILADINSADSLELVKSLKPDLLLNARTRAFFKKNLLSIPKFGCINVHHGLLPDQRGLMCDFWAHFYKTSSGFSIHEMTSKLDDGALLKVVEVPSDKKDYLTTLEKGASLEAEAATEVLSQIASLEKIQGQENIKTEATKYRSNPGLLDFYKLRLRGTKI